MLKCRYPVCTYLRSAPAGLDGEKSTQQRRTGGMVEFIPAISGFGQKSKGQLSSLGGLAQYAATYLSIPRVRLR